MKSFSADAAAIRLMTSQHGFARIAQLRDLGLSRNQVADRVHKGLFERDAHGLVALSQPQRTLHARAMRAVLIGGDGAVAGLWTAAELHGLDAPRSDQTHVLVQASRKRGRVTDVYVHRTRHLPSDHIVEIESVPTTSLPRTIVDCATWLDRWSALRMLDSCSATPSTWRAIQVTAETLSNGRAGVRAIAEATSPDGAVRMRSALERMGREALRVRGVPDGQWNVMVYDGKGPVREVDLCFRDERVAVELDGLRFHRRRSRSQRDRTTDRRLQLDGWRILRYTWQDVAHRPAEMAHDVMQALHRR